MTNETQQTIGRERKGLVGKLGAVKDAIAINDWKTVQYFGFGERYTTLISLKKNDIYLRFVEASQNPKERQSRRDELQDAMNETPLLADLQEREHIYAPYLDKPVVVELARRYQANPNYALKYLSRVFSADYLSAIGSSHFLSGDYWGKEFPWGNSRLIDSDELIKADLAIVGGRLAKINGKSPDKFYNLAKDCLKKVSCGIGGIVMHFGTGVSGLLDTSQLISQREKILEKEFGGKK